MSESQSCQTSLESQESQRLRNLTPSMPDCQASTSNAERPEVSTPSESLTRQGTPTPPRGECQTSKPLQDKDSEATLTTLTSSTINLSELGEMDTSSLEEWAKRQRQAGADLTAIAETLNISGQPTPAGRPWSRQAVHRLVQASDDAGRVVQCAWPSLSTLGSEPPSLSQAQSSQE